MPFIKTAGRVAAVMAGFGLLAAGIAMLLLPGPGWLTIAAGLAILATEFVWARRALNGLKRAGRAGLERVKRRNSDDSDADEADRERDRRRPRGARSD
jgi:uncharacterized protein (TIGR02611 family)